MKSKTTKVVLAILAVLLLLLAAGEFALRTTVSNQIKSSMGEEASISFGATPLMSSLITKNVPHVEISSPSTIAIQESNPPQISGNPEVHISITDLDISNPEAAIASHMEMRPVLGRQYLLATIQQSLTPHEQADAGYLQSVLQAIIQVTDLQPVAHEGVLRVEFSGGAGTLDLRPVVVDEGLGFEATNVSLMGFDLPGVVADGLTQGLRGQAQQLGAGLEVRQASVTDEGMELVLVGSQVDLSAL